MHKITREAIEFINPVMPIAGRAMTTMGFRNPAYREGKKALFAVYDAAFESLAMQDVYEAYEADPPKAREMDSIEYLWNMCQMDACRLHFGGSKNRIEYSEYIERYSMEYTDAICEQIQKARDNKTRILAERGRY